MIGRMRVGYLLVGLAVSLVPGTSQTYSAKWLDSPLKQWNIAGAKLPVEPIQDWDKAYPECRPLHHPEVGEEEAVAKAGWMIFGSSGDEGKLAVVSGGIGFDGMCRPDDLQLFVFVEGKFAGTLSPAPMYARSDGVVATVSIPESDKIVVEFKRYEGDDPLCCPSGMSEATFLIQRDAKGPVATLISVRTRSVRGPA